MPTELRQLRHVIALADHGNFARAAEALRMSQPALSRSVQSVERELGARLFQRTPSGAEPTDVGHLFVLRARQIVQMSDDLGAELANDRSLQSGHIAIGGGPWPGQCSLTLALTRFVAAYPLVTAQLSIREWDELLRRLRSRELDLFVGETSTIEREGDLVIEALKPHPMFLVARSGHPLAGRGDLAVSEMFDYPLAAMSRLPPRILEPFRAAQRHSGKTVATARSFPAIECGTLAVLKHLVLGTDVIMAAMLSTIRVELESRQLTLLGSAPWLTTRYGIVTLRNNPMSAAATRFREFIHDAEREIEQEEAALLARWQPGTGDARSRPARSPRRPAGSTGQRK
jgi:DNA-binding transcriptional LysR family regulator